MAPTTRNALHAAHATTGLTQIFSSKVADYVAARPGYPAALFDWLRHQTGLPAGTPVADVAAGTGLFTQGLLGLGWQVTAVEPSDAMRAAADATCRTHAGYTSLAGTAEALPLADGSHHLLGAAQAAHWFDTTPTLAEFKRVLVPGGWLVLATNDRVMADPLHQAFDAWCTEFGGAARQALVAHEQARDALALFGGAPVQTATWPHVQWLDADGLLALLRSRSGMPAPGSAAAAELAGRVTAWVPAGERVAVRYVSTAHLGRIGPAA
ncbi:MAG: class I SAM-dependent methyltransferase [Proteobacteria bacterium]|nr:class I SAM-dependent methyltransferase [Pseudomonadota bacterium]